MHLSYTYVVKRGFPPNVSAGALPAAASVGTPSIRSDELHHGKKREAAFL